MPCFTAGSMKALSNNQYAMYSNAQNTFMRIRSYDFNISTARRNGNTSLSYYEYKEGERALYIMGQRLMIQNDPLNAANYYDFVKY